MYDYELRTVTIKLSFTVTFHWPQNQTWFGNFNS